MSADSTPPSPEHKFSFGLWTVGNLGRDPFGDRVRQPLPPVDAVPLLAEVGAWGVNLHDNDLVPIDATPAERDRIVEELQGRLRQTRPRRAHGHHQPVHRSGLQGRRLHRQRPARARLRAPEDHARDGPGRGTGREDVRLVGRARRHRDRRLPAPATTPSSACARRSTSCATTRSTRSTTTSSPWKPSRTSRAATSTWPRPGTCSGFIPRSTTPRWSA